MHTNHYYIVMNYKIKQNAKYNINDFKGAIADYTKAISLDPNNAEVYLWRGYAKIEIKDKIGACKDFSKAGELELKEAYDAINKKSDVKRYFLKFFIRKQNEVLRC